MKPKLHEEFVLRLSDDTRSNKIYFLGVPLMLFCILYACLARSTQDCDVYGTRIFLALFVIIIAICIYLWKAEKRTFGELLFAFFLLSFLAFWYTFVIYGFFASVTDLFTWVGRALHSVSRHAVIPASLAAVIVLCIGSLLYFVRFRFRACFGITEAAVGLVIGMERLASQPIDKLPPAQDFLLVLLTASVYLIVRGFDNVYQGVHSTPSDPIAQWVLASIKKGKILSR